MSNMYLRSLYSEPAGLFSTVVFKDGVNFIFGKKDTTEDSKESLNGIGKTTVLDLLDFCLLASHQKNHNPRIDQAKELLAGHSIVLEIEIANHIYVIKRTIEEPNMALFGEKDNLHEFKIDDLKESLSEMVLLRKQYQGVFYLKWWRKLISFFLKIQKHKKDRFLDPIKYISESSVAELNQYQLFLLGIDNSLAVKNYRILCNLKDKKPLIREIKKLLEETYEIKSIKDAQNTISSLKREIEQLQRATENFVLADQYRDAEQRANQLTSEIKSLWFDNHRDRRQIESYRESYSMDDGLTDSELTRVKRLYDELRDELGEKVSKTLEEARKFRQQLRESRREFLSAELKRLQTDINAREGRISQIESERKHLFTFLDAREAIKDLTGAYSTLTEKQKVLSDLEGKLKNYNTLEFERLDLEKEAKVLEIEIKKFIDDVQNDYLPTLSSIFVEVYNAIYPRSKDSLFTFTDQFTTDAKMQIDIEFPAMMSKGKNQGRTLVYDIAVLLNMIKRELPGPRFIVHDGIFDGMDKAHLAHLYHFIESKKQVDRFQYVVTLNEEGTLSENFGPADEISPDKIAKEAILVLTPTRKLFGRDF